MGQTKHKRVTKEKEWVDPLGPILDLPLLVCIFRLYLVVQNTKILYIKGSGRVYKKLFIVTDVGYFVCAWFLAVVVATENSGGTCIGPETCV